MQADLKALLDTITIGGNAVPNALMHFDGESDAFLVYSPSSESVALAGDDLPTASRVRFDIDLYSKGNYIELSDTVINTVVSGGWTWVGNSNDTYDDETGYYHRLIEIEKQRGVSYGE